MDDRRSNGRTRITKAASLFFSGQTGARSCDVNITDVTDDGAGIRTQGLAILPLTFELSFENLRRKCRLVWRKGNFFGVTFENHCASTYSETDSESDFVIPRPALLASNDRPQLTYFDNVERMVRIHFEDLRPKKTAPNQPSFYDRGRHRSSSTGINRHGRLHCSSRGAESELMARRVHPYPVRW